MVFSGTDERRATRDERRATVVEPNGVFQLLDGGWRCLIGVALIKTVLYENNLKEIENEIKTVCLLPISYCGPP
jgi:hypothetical protein